MKNEAGKYYKTRDGQVVGPMKRGTGFMCHWVADTVISGGYGSSWFIDGSFWPDESPYKDEVNKMLDLIEPAYPEKGTLKAIGAKVGDVVECVSGIPFFDYGNFRCRKIYTGDDIPGVHHLYNIKYGIGSFGDDDGTWRIISRASDKPTSPVRTVTTTRKDVVPGVYGRLRVSASITDSDDVCIEIVGGMAFSGQELTAAIATLTEIRDALT